MFGLSARVAGFYAALAFPLALFCAIPYFEHSSELDDAAERRYLRRAWLLVALSPLHLLFPLTALGITRDAQRLASNSQNCERERRHLACAAGVGLVVSIAIFVAIAIIAA